MRLEDQSVKGTAAAKDLHRRFIDELLRLRLVYGMKNDGLFHADKNATPLREFKPAS